MAERLPTVMLARLMVCRMNRGEPAVVSTDDLQTAEQVPVPSDSGSLDLLMQRASMLCVQAQTSLTPLRRHILAELHQRGRPCGAYDLADACRRETGRRIQASSVYRVLDFFSELGLVTHLPARNAFVLLDSHSGSEVQLVFVCVRCGTVFPYEASVTTHAISKAARATGFRMDFSAIEVRGFCARCVSRLLIDASRREK